MITYIGIKNAMSSIYKFATIAIVAACVIFGIYSYQKIKSLEYENEILVNNNISLENTLSGEIDNNSSLRMTIDEVNASNDKLTKKLSEVISGSGFKPKDVSSGTVVVSGIDTTITDTLVIENDCSFDKTLMINDQTSSRIILKASKNSVDTLINTLEIKDTVTIIKGLKSPYNKIYSDKKIIDFFARLVRFDFKRNNLKSYEIRHSNEAIKNEGVRIIDIED